MYIFKIQNKYCIYMFCTDNTENIYVVKIRWLMDITSIFYMLSKGLYVFHTVNILTHNVNKNSLQSKYIHRYNINPRIIAEMRALKIMMFNG